MTYARREDFALLARFGRARRAMRRAVRRVLCPCCGGRRTTDLPQRDEMIDDYPCPVCRPWPQGFPGLRAHGRWVIEPSEPGRPAKWVGWGK